VTINTVVSSRVSGVIAPPSLDDIVLGASQLPLKNE
jgi:hypothetical protein